MISIANTLGLGVVKLLMETEPQTGFVGADGVDVGGIGAEVFVRVGGILVAVGGFGVKVIVGESVGEGRTRSVLVGSNVIVGIGVRVGVGDSVGVDVISLSICPCASSSDTGVISSSEQK